MIGDSPATLAFLLIAAAGALGTLWHGWLARLALRRIPRLPAAGETRPALLSVVAAARDEEDGVEAAVRSWLAAAVPGLELVVVDDRSRDRTGEILDTLAAEDDRLRVVHVERRPDGWLGKCWALSEGARVARGDALLFADADVELTPDALPRALAAMERERADVLVLVPDVGCDTVAQRVLSLQFFLGFLPTLGAHRANRDDGRCSVGVGAFTLVRREAYEAVGGHDSIRLQVGDDVALARTLVREGFRHRLFDGGDVASVHWQRGGVAATIRGLEKNAFWALRLSAAWLVAFTAAVLVGLSPLVAPAVLGPASPLAWGLVAPWLLGAALPWSAVRAGVPLRVAGVALAPLSTLLLLVAAWRSAILTWRRGGITWRGDLFSTSELRAALKPLRWWVDRR